MEFADLAVTGRRDALSVSIVPASNSWVALPQAYVNSYIDQHPFPAVLRLRMLAAPEKDWIVSWQGDITKQASEIEVPAALAEALQLSQGDQVSIDVVEGCHAATLVYLEAASKDDYDVVETEAELLTKSILQQMKAVRQGDIIPIWIRGKSSARVRVLSTSPACEVLLTNDTIVSIKPPDAAGNLISKVDDSNGSDADKVANMLNGVNGNTKPKRVTGPLRLRVLEWKGSSFEMPMRVGDKAYHTALTVGAFVPPKLAAAANISRAGRYYQLHKSPSSESSDHVLVILYAHADAPPGHVCMASDLMSQLGVTCHSQVWLHPDVKTPAALSKATKLTFSRLIDFAQEMQADEDADSDDDARPMHEEPAHALEDLDDEEDQLPGNAGIQQIVWDCLSRGCEPLLAAAASAPGAASLRSLLSQEKGVMGTIADGRLEKDASIASVMHPPLRVLLKSWLHAQWKYLNDHAVSLPGGTAPLSAPAYLLVPRTVPLTLQATPPATESHSFLLSWQSASTYTVYVTDPSKDDLESMDIAGGEPVTFPISNVILTVPKWAPHVFFKPPEHARVYKPSAGSLLPNGKGWLDLELQRALRIAIPYLAIHFQGMWSSSAVPPPGGILVSGGKGSGKTALLERCAAYLSEHPATLCHVSRMNCREMAGDKLKRVAKWLQNCLSTSLMHAPAVVIFDDIDALIPVIPEHAPPQEQQHMGLIIEFLANVFDWLREKAAETGTQVLLLASCTDVGKLPNILRSTGRLDHFIEVGTPNTLERAGMIQHMLALRGLACDGSAVEHISRLTEGFDSSDLSVVIERTVQSRRLAELGGWERGLWITLKDWDDALAGFQPKAAWEAGMKDTVDASVTGWADVGGMSDAKEVLYEAIELPLRYAKLVAKAPLRLRTGVLLYGPPGCGKTHTVRAAVAAAGVRFIGVKGPELLNKYIGASEEAVRSTFKRAQAAAPCVLFFDEFDSIAPQRGTGSDSTGVTERCVNQLLTELDGVEKLQGVCVIAASNRPDLIDAALLRPGRLDRLIYCGFPGNDERKAILKALFHKVKTDGSVDLDRVASATEGFSGADLQAIASESQLAAVLKVLEDARLAEEKPGPEARKSLTPPCVTQQHVDKVLETARPSLGPEQRTAMRERYQAFRQSRQDNTVSPFSEERDAARKNFAKSLNSMKVAMA